MDVNAISAGAVAEPQRPAAGFGTVQTPEFFQLIIQNLLNQDPLEPMDNDKLLEQIASLRQIESNQQMSASMRSLIDQQQALMNQQRFGSAASLLGQFVEGAAGSAADAAGSAHGLVTGVRFDEGGRPMLQLDSGQELPLDQVEKVTSLDMLRQRLTGRVVEAQVQGDGGPEQVRGTVMEVLVSGGNVRLELDTGEQVGLQDLTFIED